MNHLMNSLMNNEVSADTTVFRGVREGQPGRRSRAGPRAEARGAVRGTNWERGSRDRGEAEAETTPQITTTTGQQLYTKKKIYYTLIEKSLSLLRACPQIYHACAQSTY